MHVSGWLSHVSSFIHSFNRCSQRCSQVASLVLALGTHGSDRTQGPAFMGLDDPEEREFGHSIEHGMCEVVISATKKGKSGNREQSLGPE